jgi:hypothetical protein
MSAAPAAPPAEWVDIDDRPGAGRLLSRIYTFCLVEMQRLRHDRSELLTRAIQPLLWLLIFGSPAEPTLPPSRRSRRAGSRLIGSPAEPALPPSRLSATSG